MISEEDCIKVLQNYLQTSDVKFKHFDIKPISENAEGFLGEHYKLKITHEKAGKQVVDQFFIKSMPTKNSAHVEIVRDMGIFKREIFVYNVLLKEYKKYGFDTSFAAQCYLCKGDQLMVLEDLTTKGFALSEREINLDLNHLQSALYSLAMYHAAGYAFEKKKEEELGRKFLLGKEYQKELDEYFFVQQINKDHFSMNWWKANEKNLLALINELPEDLLFKERFRNLLNNFEGGKVFVLATKIAKTSGHGDLWSNNMMYKNSENQNMRVCGLVDFQLCRYFYPTLDFVLAVYCNTDQEFRERHLNDLLKFHYTAMATTLRKYKYNIEDILPWDDYIKSYNLVLVDGLLQVLLTNCISRLPKEKLTHFVKEEGAGLYEMLFDNTDMSVEAFKKDAEYRRIITESLNDLYHALLKHQQHLDNL